MARSKRYPKISLLRQRIYPFNGSSSDEASVSINTALKEAEEKINAYIEKTKSK